jgi:hypothetical protein
VGTENLASMYSVNFYLIKHAGMSLSDIENMLPFEREVYANLYLKYMQEKKKALEEARGRQR